LAKYGKAAAKTVKSAMHRKKTGTLKSGSGRTVKSRKQAIAIGLNEARKKGAKVPRKAARKSATGRKAAASATTRKSTVKTTGRKPAARTSGTRKRKKA
jgi:hypothetical protein